MEDIFSKRVEDYEKRTLLAECNGNGKVYLAKHKINNKFVCIKKYEIDKESLLGNLSHEILAIRQFRHPNILPILTSFVVNLDAYVVSPLICYGSCKDTINNCFISGFPESIAVLIIKDVLNALDYLHKKNFIHRSIKATHILLDQNRAILSGFRDCISCLVHGERMKSFHNLPENSKSLNWLAPELLEQSLQGYTEKSDIYSVGVTVCELCNGIEPFSDMMTTFMLTEKIRGNQPSLLDASTCPDEENLIIDQSADQEELNLALKTRQIYLKKQFSDHLHKFAESCMQRDPDQRPSIAQLLHHPVFKQTKYTNLHDLLSSCGIEAVDFSKIQDDQSLELTEKLRDMSLDFEWDF